MVKKGIGGIVLCLACFTGWPQAREPECRTLLKKGQGFPAQFKAVDVSPENLEP